MRHLLLLRLSQPIALTRSQRPLFRLGMGSEDVMRNGDTQKINLLFSIYSIASYASVDRALVTVETEAELLRGYYLYFPTLLLLLHQRSLLQ